MTGVVVLEFCGEPLALTREQLEEARIRAREFVPTPQNAPASSPEFVDAATLAALTSVPQSWIEEQARRKTIPSLMLGKYRRFDVAEALAAIGKLGRRG